MSILIVCRGMMSQCIPFEVRAQGHVVNMNTSIGVPAAPYLTREAVLSATGDSANHMGGDIQESTSADCANHRWIVGRSAMVDNNLPPPPPRSGWQISTCRC